MPEHIIATKYFSPSLNGLPTNMSFAQHGVFVAKIIQHLAPQATLELIRVLGNYGGGDLRSIIYGLFYVYQQGNLSHTIVNMSLTLQPPTECLPFLVGELPAPFFTTSANWAQCPAETVANIANNPVDARLFVPMGLVMEQMSAAGATLVAAAGNDSTSAYRLGADMPGAYCHALAVSALVGGPIGAFVSGSQSVGQLAIYSNAPALENGQCLSISLTPNVLSQPITSGSTNPFAYAAGTACSLFMDRSNPKYVNTTTESTYWSGTSFSAPVFSAEMAIAFANSSKFFPGTFQYTDPCG
jgi:hypothetical protein